MHEKVRPWMLGVHFYEHSTSCLLIHLVPTLIHNFISHISHLNFGGIIKRDSVTRTHKRCQKKKKKIQNVLSLTDPHASSIYKRRELGWLRVAIFEANVQSQTVFLTVLLQVTCALSILATGAALVRQGVQGYNENYFLCLVVLSLMEIRGCIKYIIVCFPWYSYCYTCVFKDTQLKMVVKVFLHANVYFDISFLAPTPFPKEALSFARPPL